METTQKQKNLSYLLGVAGFVIGLILDQFSKYLAATDLKQSGPNVLINGVFQLRYLENRGAAFGIMQNKQYFFVIGAVIVLAVIAFFYTRMPFTKRYQPLRICAVLLCAGAVGNMIDRIRLDYVIDFFYFNLIDFPIFNVADCYVVVACIAFVLLILFYYKEDSDFDFLSLKKSQK
nr:signal peptidase II [uncultured Mediterraneibacter sp.]